MKLPSPSLFFFPPERRVGLPESLLHRMPYLVRVDIIMMVFFLFAAGARFAANPEEYLWLAVAVASTALFGFPTSLFLLRAGKFGAASLVSSVSTLINVCWAGFLVPVESVLDPFRFMMWIVVAVTTDNLVALDLRQVLIFAAMTTVSFAAYVLGVIGPAFGLATVASDLVILLVLVVFVNMVAYNLAKMNADLIDVASRQAARSKARAESLSRIVEGARDSFKIGESLSERASEGLGAAIGARAGIGALEAKARRLASDAKAADESNKAVLLFQRDMGEIVTRQNAAVRETGSTLAEIGETVSNLAALSMSRRASIGSALSGLEAQNESMRGLGQAIRRVRESFAKVLEAVSSILDVSEKTALLSMNASIEAAHSGAHGRGFAVIASEIRKLSEDSRTGAAGIKAALAENDRVIAEAAGDVDSFAANLTATTDEVRTTLGSIEEIIKGLSEMDAAVAGLNAASASLSTASGRAEDGVARMAEAAVKAEGAIGGLSNFAAELREAASTLLDGFSSIENALRKIDEAGKSNMANIADLGDALSIEDEAEKGNPEGR